MAHSSGLSNLYPRQQLNRAGFKLSPVNCFEVGVRIADKLADRETSDGTSSESNNFHVKTCCVLLL